MRRVGLLQAILRDDTNHAQRFLRRRVGCVREQTLSRWPAIETCSCLKGSRAQRSFVRLFGRMGSSRSSAESEAWEAFLRIEAARWTVASGMRLASHVKAQYGETKKFRLVL